MATALSFLSRRGAYALPRPYPTPTTTPPRAPLPLCRARWVGQNRGRVRSRQHGASPGYMRTVSTSQYALRAGATKRRGRVEHSCIGKRTR
eukprot:1778393-Pleurochrysis_carterae.AAC.4